MHFKIKIIPRNGFIWSFKNHDIINAGQAHPRVCASCTHCLPYCSTASKPHTASRSMPFRTASREHVGSNIPVNGTLNIPDPARSLSECHIHPWTTDPVRVCSFPYRVIPSEITSVAWMIPNLVPAVFHRLFDPEIFLASSKPWHIHQRGEERTVNMDSACKNTFHALR